jgi:hypothetical protein
VIVPDLWKKVVDLRKDFRKAPHNWFVANAEQEDDEDEDENSSELVSPRGSMGSHRNPSRSGDSDETSIVLDVSSPRRTPRGGSHGSLKRSQRQANEKETEAKFLSEVEKRVEERLKLQEEAMRTELMQQFKHTSVMSDKEKVLAEIDPKQVVKHFSVGKGYVVIPYPHLSLWAIVLILPVRVLIASITAPSVRCLRDCCTVRKWPSSSCTSRISSTTSCSMSSGRRSRS